MGLTIKNDEVEKLARELASRRNISITEAVRQSLETEMARENLVLRPERSERLVRMLEIAASVAALPRISNMTEDEILGYDENGAPTR